MHIFLTAGPFSRPPGVCKYHSSSHLWNRKSIGLSAEHKYLQTETHELCTLIRVWFTNDL